MSTADLEPYFLAALTGVIASMGDRQDSPPVIATVIASAEAYARAALQRMNVLQAAESEVVDTSVPTEPSVVEDDSSPPT